MGELDDNFARLFGRQANDKDKQDLYLVRDVLKVKTTDSVWAFLMVLQYYKALYAEFPARIEAAARDVTERVRAAAEAQAKAAHAEARRALIDAVHQAAVKSAAYGAGGWMAKWVSIAVGIVAIALVALGWVESSRGHAQGRSDGENGALKTCAALTALSSWATTPDGQLAYALAKAGGLGDVARCSGRGMVPRDGWCMVQSDRGKPLARWPLPVTGAKSSGGAP
jgi:hypothetical protein